MKPIALLSIFGFISRPALATGIQKPFSLLDDEGSSGSWRPPPPLHLLSHDDTLDDWELPLADLKIYPLFISGNASNRVDLVFFGDGYLKNDSGKLEADAQTLAEEIIYGADPHSVDSDGGAFGVVKPLLNIWAVHVPSNESGIGDHDVPRDTPFGLYRPGPELRGVYYAYRSRAMRLCSHLQATGGTDVPGYQGMRVGCDEPVLLGNDPLYGGLGGTPTVITASAVNGPLVLRHELGHTLIPVGEEYEGGWAYDGVNSNPLENLKGGNLTWKHWLSEDTPEGEDTRLEDVQVPLQEYPWHNLTESPYNVTFNSTAGSYPTAMLRISISSIPDPSHLNLTIGSTHIPFSLYPESVGSKDRAWVEVHLPKGIAGLTGVKPGASHVLSAALTEAGMKAEEGQGGKMITSLEMIEYGTPEKCNLDENFIGAFPTYAEDGSVTVRPTNEYCLMRNVRRSTFCPVCAEGLTLSLLKRVSLIDGLAMTCNDGTPTLSLETIAFPGGRYSVRLSKLTAGLDSLPSTTMTGLKGGTITLPADGVDPGDHPRGAFWGVDVELKLDVVRLKGRPEMRASTEIWFEGCKAAA